MLRIELRFLMALVVFASFGCSREEGDSDKGSKVQISLPQTVSGFSQKVGAFSLASTAVLNRVVINATGEGMALKTMMWDSCRDCATPNIPASFDLEVPGGPSRLIQLIAVYEDSVTEQLSIYYGDVTTELVGGEINLPIEVTKINQSTLVQGRVTGRYLTAANSGPTGVVDVQYLPGNGKPPLVVTQEHMLSGWFNFFMLSGAQLKYVVRGTGEVLWGGSVSLDSPIFNHSNKVLKALVPVHVRKQYDSEDAVYEYTLQDAQIYVWGYWSPGAHASTQRVCTSAVTGSASNLKRYDAVNPSSSSPLAINRVMTALPTNYIETLTNTTTPATEVKVAGGIDMSSLCDSFPNNSTNLFSQFQLVSLSMFDGTSRDEVGGFQGPFILNAGGGGLFYAEARDYPNRSHILTTQPLLPGASEAVAGFKVYKKSGVSPNFYLENPDCANPGSIGYTAVGGITPTVGSESLTLEPILSDLKGTAAIICPIMVSGYNQIKGLYVSTHRLPTFPSSIGINLLTNNLTVEECGQGHFYFKDMAGEVIPSFESATMNITHGGLSGTINTDPACTAGGTAMPFSIAAASTISQTFFFKFTAAGSGSIMANGNFGGGPTLVGNTPLVVIP